MKLSTGHAYLDDDRWVCPVEDRGPLFRALWGQLCVNHVIIGFWRDCVVTGGSNAAYLYLCSRTVQTRAKDDGRWRIACGSFSIRQFFFSVFLFIPSFASAIAERSGESKSKSSRGRGGRWMGASFVWGVVEKEEGEGVTHAKRNNLDT